MSGSIGSGGFGTRFMHRDQKTDQLVGQRLVVDFAANAASLGAEVFAPHSIATFKDALAKARKLDHTCVIVIQTDREERVPGYESWWDVAVAETSTMPSVKKARKEYEEKKKKEKYFL